MPKDFASTILPDPGLLVRPDILSASCYEVGGFSEVNWDFESSLRSGKDIQQFTALLRAMLGDFVRSFDDLSDPKTLLKLWSQAAALPGNGSGPFYISGRVTAFCVHRANGERVYTPPQGPVEIEVLGWNMPGCETNGTIFHRVDSGTVPNAFVYVPVSMDRCGIVSRVRMLAGLVGIQISSSDESLDDGFAHCGAGVYQAGPSGFFMPATLDAKEKATPDLRSIQPLSVRWMFALSDGIEDVSDGVEIAAADTGADDMVAKLEEILKESLTLAGKVDPAIPVIRL
ncbi:hypothetical protein F5Y15DRAFT_345992 [Xylariaceae sp. FL0016]|nr:hypothetical protein F5Y15DRAFT_345992 [Xylariaceae sp. FL0016]